MPKSKKYNWREDPYFSAVPPIYLGVAHGFPSADDAAAIFAGKKDGYAYARMGNPTVAQFEAWLEELDGGEKALATCSGLAAELLLVHALTEPGKKKIVSSPFIYGGSFHMFDLLKTRGYKIKFVEDAFNPKSWEEAITPDTAFAFLESPSNPRSDVFDIKKIAAAVHKNKTLLVVDNTIAPAIQKPLKLGADIVVYSVTKYLNRQSSGLGGAAVFSEKIWKKHGKNIFDWYAHLGLMMHPLTAWFSLQNSYTLERDMKTFTENAREVAAFLSKHPKVKKVYYSGRSGLMSFEMQSFEAAKKFVGLLKKIILAPHLGDVRDLIIHPASTTHSRLSEKDLAKVHITKNLVRFSVGLGDTRSTIADLSQALKQV